LSVDSCQFRSLLRGTVPSTDADRPASLLPDASLRISDPHSLMGRQTPCRLRYTGSGACAGASSRRHLIWQRKMKKRRQAARTPYCLIISGQPSTRLRRHSVLLECWSLLQLCGRLQSKQQSPQRRLAAAHSTAPPPVTPRRNDEESLFPLFPGSA
jgi:hypothetical protein